VLHITFIYNKYAGMIKPTILCRS